MPTIENAVSNLMHKQADVCIVKNSPVRHSGIRFGDYWISYTFDILTNIKFKDDFNYDMNCDMNYDTNYRNGNFKKPLSMSSEHFMYLSEPMPSIETADIIFLSPKFRRILLNELPKEQNYGDFFYLTLDEILHWLLLLLYRSKEIVNR
jgi:hypothetical protein